MTGIPITASACTATASASAAISRLGLGRPSAAQTRVVAGPHITPIDVVINYRRGMAFRPLGALT